MTTQGDAGEGRTVAAVDLGSNSFHMVVARWAGGRLHVVDKLRERVALAEGLDAKRRLSGEAQERAIACLERFGQRLAEMPADSVRAVGTNTIRSMRKGREFLTRAQEALGHDIDVIPGREEARLIYQGVAHDILHGVGEIEGRRLVVDIGGGSTECVLGERLDVLECDSLFMGCVSFTQRFFRGGKLSRGRMDRARIAARRELEPIRRRYRTIGWDHAIGASGTIRAVERILVALGWTQRHIRADDLRRLRKQIQSSGKIESLDLPGLSEERRLVIAGGVAVLSGVFDSFGIEEMETSDNALREGLLYDLLGRIHHEDLRDHTVRRFQERTHVDRDQATRVERVALHLLDVVGESWELADPLDRKLLAWAAQIHEGGLAIARSGYHKHGAYVVGHSDMPGFSREDQAALATIVRTHRRKLSPELFDAVAPAHRRRVLRLTVLLRLARRLCRGRGSRPPVPESVRADGDEIELTFPAGWLDHHPLTRADLDEERELLAAAGVVLRVA